MGWTILLLSAGWVLFALGLSCVVWQLQRLSRMTRVLRQDLNQLDSLVKGLVAQRGRFL